MTGADREADGHVPSSVRRPGVTLLELLAVLVILVILSRILFLHMHEQTAAAAEQACFENKSQINVAIERFLFEKGSLPQNLRELDVPDCFPDGLPTCPVREAVYELDQRTGRVAGHTPGNH